MGAVALGRVDLYFTPLQACWVFPRNYRVGSLLTISEGYLSREYYQFESQDIAAKYGHVYRYGSSNQTARLRGGLLYAFDRDGVWQCYKVP